MLPVLIIGGGPVGLALAGELGWRGVECVVVDQGDGEVFAPRMDMVSARTMEFCRRWGIAEQIKQADYPQDRGQDIVYVDSVAGRCFGREHFPTRAQQRPPEWSPETRDRCPQHLFDPLMRAFASSLPTVTLRYGVRLIDFEQSKDRVQATLERTEDGSRESIGACWLAGCDGASSTVRKTLGIQNTGKGPLTRSVNIMFRLPDLDSYHDKGVVYRFMLFDRTGPWATLVAISGYDDWRLQVIDGGSQRWGVEEARDAVARALGFDASFEILSVNNWLRNEQVAGSYRGGRAFLVGDAAHTLSPTGGFGMNTGIGDAVDLGWKLAAVVQGWASADLLESYSAERQPIGVKNSRIASANLARMRGLVPPQDAFESEAGQREWGEVVSHTMRKEWHSPGVLVGYRYEDSPVCVEDGDVPPEPIPWRQQCVVGGRAPHAWVDPRQSTLDWFGRGFVLLHCGATAPGLARAAATRGIPFSEQELPEKLLSLYGRRLTLVRPDGHVAWRSDQQPADPMRVMAKVTGSATDAAGNNSREAA